jgi:glycosyltransferase involved in cell wall biosynthesis
MKNLLSVSIIIATYNSERTLSACLKSIENQVYPQKKLEVIIVDGRSTDSTLGLIKKSKLKIKVIQGKYPSDPEACKGEGLAIAKGEVVGLIDSDNYLPHKNWITKMIDPLIENPEVVGSFTWRFAYNKNDAKLNRYFSLIGSADPVGLYLGKADKMSYISDKWTGFGDVICNAKSYFLVEFDEEHFPTLGSNGFFARRKYLLKGKSKPNQFFHIDVPFDILKFNLNKYAIVKDVVVHDTAENMMVFLRKRVRYMRLHYQKRSGDRRYRVFDPESKRDVMRLLLFIFFSFTFIQPLYISLRGYLKLRDSAWLLHPIFCFCIAISYSIAIISRYSQKEYK